MDAVDGVIVDFSAAMPPLRLLAHAQRPIPLALADEFLSLNQPHGTNELHRAALAGNALSRLYADVVSDLLSATRLNARQVRAVAVHGQTVRHQPGQVDGVGYSLQLGNPALLAELTGIDVIADFRSRDLAAGGQGAPLVPGFHRALFGRTGEAVAVLNIGGISNLTSLPGDDSCSGFDCGPGNVLMDAWCQRHTGQPYDQNGDWAASGTINMRLLAQLMSEPYFTLAPPKSTGRDLFSAHWLSSQLAALAGSADWRPEDVQATLTELTAKICARAVDDHAPAATRVMVCGGGALNGMLMQRLAARLPRRQVTSTDVMAVPAMQVEAAAFAWLGCLHLQRLPGNMVDVTGARGPRVLGALYPASGPRD